MRIGLKVFSVLGIAALALILSVWTISRTMVLNQAQATEIRMATENLDRFETLLGFTRDSLSASLGNWAPRDATYEYVRGADPSFLQSQLSFHSMDNLGLDAVIFFDNTRAPLVSVERLSASGTTSVHTGSQRFLDPRQVEFLTTRENSLSVHSGLVSGKDGIWLVAAAPVTTTDFRSPPVGTLVFLSRIDERFDTSVLHLIQAHFSFSFSPGDLSGERIRTSDQSLIATRPLKDIFGDPVVAVSLTHNRGFYEEARASLLTHFFQLSGAIALLILLCLLFIHHHLTRPIESLGKMLTGEGEHHLPEHLLLRTDELGNLSRTLKHQWERLSQTNQRLTANEERLEQALSSSGSGLWDWNLSEDEMFISPEFLRRVGLDDLKLSPVLQSAQTFIHPEDFPMAAMKVRETLNSSIPVSDLQFRICSSNGSTRWVTAEGSVVSHDALNRPTRLAGIITDTTERHFSEDRLVFLNSHDKLTALWNRNYCEHELEIRTTGITGFSLMVFDINGLHLINDAFGHAAGDQVLQSFSTFLLDFADPGDLVARWGGDAFVLLTHRTEERQLDQLLLKMHDLAENHSFGPATLSFSAGYAVWMPDSCLSGTRLVREAEDRMLRSKLLETQSIRNSTLFTLKRALMEKSSETEQHMNRLTHYCQLVASSLDLSAAKTDELFLLAMLHDIGKIGIPDNILDKPGKLTDDEWRLIQTHCQIGYRIASSTPELAHIAYSILTHHERFDGRGYPKGLKGPEIPILSRIVAIADAFDVMTHERPYKSAMDRDAAFLELERCSGTQFDPDLVLRFIDALRRSAV